MGNPTFEALDRLAARQLGLLTHRQLLQLGLPSSTIWRWADEGRLARRSDSVYATPGTPDDWRVGALVAVLSSGPLARLSHRAGAALWSDGRIPGRTIEVVVPKGSHRPHGPWRVHETRRFGAADAAMVGPIPVTSIERTLIDVGRYWSPERVGRLLDDAVTRRLTTYEAFAARVAALRRRGQPGIAVARLVLADRDVFEGTPFEQRMRRLLRSTDLPEAAREHRVTVDGKDYFVDFAFPEAALGIECDSSAWHTQPHQFEYDLRRQNDILGTGMLLLRYTSRRLREDPESVLGEVIAQYRRRTNRSGGV